MQFCGIRANPQRFDFAPGHVSMACCFNKEKQQ
jgi:hypothetical protein